MAAGAHAHGPLHRRGAARDVVDLDQRARLLHVHVDRADEQAQLARVLLGRRAIGGL